jgi:hypothetical protein
MGRGSECGFGRCSKRSWGAWASDVAGDLSVRARVRACWSTTGRGEGRVDRGSHGAARENGRAGETVQRTDEAVPRGREGKECAGEGPWRRQSGPTRQRERGRRRELRGNAADRWSPPVRRHGHARSLAGLDGPVWAALTFSIFLEFLIAFLFLFL